MDLAEPDEEKQNGNFEFLDEARLSFPSGADLSDMDVGTSPDDEADISYLLGKGKALEDEEKWMQAVICYSEGLDSHPEDRKLLRARGIAKYFVGLDKDTTDNMRPAIFTDALVDLSEVTSHDHIDGQALYYKACAYSKVIHPSGELFLDELAEMQIDLDLATIHPPRGRTRNDWWEPYLQRALVKATRGMYQRDALEEDGVASLESALKDTQRALKKRGDMKEFDIHNMRSSILLDLDRKEEAAAELEKAEQLIPPQAITYISALLGFKFRRAGRPGKAIPLLEFALEQEPQNTEYMHELVVACAQADDLEGVERNLTRIINQRKDVGTSWNERGDFYQSGSDWQLAISDYTTSLELESDWQVHVKRATCYGKLERHDEALEDLDEALRCDNVDAAQVYRFRLMCNVNREDLESAREDFEVIAELNPEDDFLSRHTYLLEEDL